jgi:uncharacterized protein
LKAFHPGRLAVDSYGNGGFRFGEMSHRGSLLVLPSGMHGWRPGMIEEVTPDDLRPLLAEQGQIDLVLFGAGSLLRRPTAEIRAILDQAKLVFEVMSTAAAVRTYNILLAEDRRVAAALIAVEARE